MPYLDNIIQQLNEKLTSSSLNFIPAGKIRSYGIAETMLALQDVTDGEGKVSQKTIRYPAVIDNDGEAQMIDVDDDYSIIIYHRLETISNAVVPKGTYGRSPEILESSNMAMIILAFRDQVRKTAYWLEGIIKDQFPDRVSVKDDTTVLQTSTLRIGNSNFDKLSLLQREYSEVELNFPQLIILELKYRIENIYKKGCFNNCDSC